MRMQPLDHQGYQLLHEGAIALARVESNGICVDVDYYKKALVKVDERIKDLERQMMESEVWEQWRKMYGAKAKFTARQQLAEVLQTFDCVGKLELSEAGNAKLDADVLDTIDLPFCKQYVQAEKLRKLNGTYLKGTLEEVSPDGKLRCFFNLHLATTYRSSASNPNIQNQPIRDALQGKIIRKGFKPRPGHRIVEIDYSSIEVRVAACYHRDPAMLKYLTDDSTDMHRDTAADMFMLPHEQITKQARFCGKNSFVFPAFYGDYYVSMAKGIWSNMLKLDVKTADGVPMIEHLKSKGIQSLGACNPDKEALPGTFEYHIKQVEDVFWNERFCVYNEWKKKWYHDYIENGYFKSLSGFVFSGTMRRNNVINSPVQSAAFHCLLWSLIEVQKQLRKRKMKTVIVGQIHDSLIADVHEDEFEDYLKMASGIMTTGLKERFPWINGVPIDVEAEATEVDGNWWDKSVVDIPE